MDATSTTELSFSAPPSPHFREGAFWIWRTRSRDVLYRWSASGRQSEYADSREVLRHVFWAGPDRNSPRCLIFVAVQPGYYWLDYKVGDGLSLADQHSWFVEKELREGWVKATRTKGPICEARLDIGGGRVLLATLSIDKARRNYGFFVYLALVAPRPGDKHITSTVPAVPRVTEPGWAFPELPDDAFAQISAV